MQHLEWLGLIVPGLLLLSAFGRRNRFRVPVVAALATGAITAVATAVISSPPSTPTSPQVESRIAPAQPCTRRQS